MSELNKETEEDERNETRSSNTDNIKYSKNENKSTKRNSLDIEELSKIILSKLENYKIVNANNYSLKLNENNILEHFLLFHKFLSAIQSNNNNNFSKNKNEIESLLQELLSKKTETENNDLENEGIPMTPIINQKIKNIGEIQCMSEQNIIKTVNKLNIPPVSLIKNKSFTEIQNENDDNNDKDTSNYYKKKLLPQNTKKYARNQNDDIFHLRDYSFDLNNCKEKNPDLIENINSAHKYSDKININKNRKFSLHEERMYEPRSSLHRKKSISIYDDEEEDHKLTNRSNFNNNTAFEIKVNKSKFISAKEQLIMVKIKELNHETQRFKEERKKVMSLKEEYEQLQTKLLQDIEDFNEKKNKFELYVLSENEKLQKDRKDFINESKFLTNLKQQNHSLAANNKIYQKKIKNLTEKIIELEGYIKKNKIQKLHKNKTKTDIITESNNKSNTQNINQKKKKDLTDLKKNQNNNIKKQDLDDLEINELITKKDAIKNQTTKILNKDSTSYYNNTMKNPKQILNKINSNETNFNINNNTINIYKDYCSNMNNRNQIRKIKSTKNVRNIYNSNNKNKNICVKKRLNQNTKLNLFTDGNIFQCSKKLISSNTKGKNFRKIKIPYFNTSEIADRELFSSNENNTRNLRRYSVRDKNSKYSNINRRPIDIIDNINCVNNINSIINKSINSINHTLFNSVDKYNFHKSISKTTNNKMLINVNSENDNYNSNSNQDNYDFIIPKKYLNQSKYTLISTIEQNNGQLINIYTNNKKEIIFKSGVKKEIYDNDGYKLVLFPNGDKKQYFKKEGKIIYYFNESKTVQTSFKNGLNIFKFNNNQIEKHYPDGTKFIQFPDGSKRIIGKENEEEEENVEKEKNLIDISSDGDEIVCNCTVNEEADKNENEILSDKESLTSLIFNGEINEEV